MTIGIDVRANTKEVERMLRDVDKNLIPRATVRALNRTAKSVRTKAARATAKETGLKVKEVKPRIDLDRASFRRLSASVIAGRWAPNLIRFTTKRQRQNAAVGKRPKQGLKVRVRGKRTLYSGAFIAPTGNTQVVLKRKGRTRLPVEPVLGPVLGNIFITREISRQVILHANETFLKEFTTAATFYLQKYR
jgi:hypothetical protein